MDQEPTTVEQGAPVASGAEAKAEAKRVRVPNLKPMEVVRAVRPLFDARDSVAKLEIAHAIREGKLRISARSWVSNKRPKQRVWKTGADLGKKRKQVPRSEFLGCNSWELDSKNWKWRSGRFHLTRDDGEGWLLMDRAVFREDDVRAFVARIKSEQTGKGGAPRKVDDWTLACIGIAEMALYGEFTEKNLGGEQAFSRALRSRLTKSRSLNLSDEAIKPLSKAIRDHFLPLIAPKPELPSLSAE